MIENNLNDFLISEYANFEEAFFGIFVFDPFLKAHILTNIDPKRILKNEIDRAGSRSVDRSSIDLFFHDPYPIRSKSDRPAISFPQ
jgi:hypothetical protein